MLVRGAHRAPIEDVDDFSLTAGYDLAGKCFAQHKRCSKVDVQMALPGWQIGIVKGNRLENGGIVDQRKERLVAYDLVGQGKSLSCLRDQPAGISAQRTSARIS